MDYALELKRSILQAKEETNQNLLEVMDMESGYILACMDSLSILEGYEAITESKGKVSFLQRLKDFFSKIFESFSNKVKQLSGSDIKWLSANANKLKQLDCKGISVEVIPHWKGPDIKPIVKNHLSQLYRDIDGVIERVMINASDKVKMPEKFGVIEKEYGGDIENLKNKLRWGNMQSPKPVKLEDSALKQLVPKMVDYCLKYESETLPFIKQQVDAVKREIQTVERAMSKLEENAMYIEGVSLLESDLRYCVGFQSLLEADKNKTVGATTVKFNTEDKKEEAPKNQDKKEDNYYQNNTKAELKYVNKGLIEIKQILSVAMTIYEERYITYMKILRHLAKGIKTDPNKDNLVTDAKKK